MLQVVTTIISVVVGFASLGFALEAGRLARKAYKKAQENEDA